MERIKGKRATQRALHTRLRNEASQLMESSHFSAPALRVLHDRLKNCNDELRVLNEQLEGYLTDEQASEDYISVADNEDNTAATLSLLCHHIEQLQSQTTADRGLPTPNDASASGTISGHRALGDTSTPVVGASRLPKLDLVHFNGTVQQWQPFWDMFKHAVHENASLTNIDRFHYLKTLLAGPAAKAIEGIQVTDASYADAIEILTNRFGNVRIIEQKYLENLRMLRPVRFSTDVTAMRNLLDTVHINVRGLKALGRSELSYAAMLVEILTKAIPNDIVVEHYKRQSLLQKPDEIQSSETELRQLLDFLRLEVEAREKSGHQDSCVRDTHDGRRDRKTCATPTASVLHNESSKTKDSRKEERHQEMCPSDDRTDFRSIRVAITVRR
ncbi:uncharacterized protein LOC125947248 [Dermacentor silvarum]|uniref:uncharacterized protein LOC125947248 n=1 Tax=Dermacentor silvarum TaxID=543639 RepID=UPI002101A499|nr:uncharacterized protein LOC125947248 [Dermacentor silvarum]